MNIAAAPALPTFYGAWALGTLAAIALALSRRLRPAEAAIAWLASFLVAGGAGLIAFWIWHPSPNRASILIGPVLLAGAVGTLGWLRPRIRRERAGLGRPVEGARVGALIAGGVALFLLPSFGAQVVAAPLTVPAMWWFGRRVGAVLRTLLAIVATLTMFIAGNLVGWLIVRDNDPAMFATASTLASATAIAFAWPIRRARGSVADDVGPVEGR